MPKTMNKPVLISISLAAVLLLTAPAYGDELYDSEICKAVIAKVDANPHYKEACRAYMLGLAQGEAGVQPSSEGYQIGNVGVLRPVVTPGISGGPIYTDGHTTFRVVPQSTTIQDLPAIPQLTPSEIQELNARIQALENSNTPG